MFVNCLFQNFFLPLLKPGELSRDARSGANQGRKLEATTMRWRIARDGAEHGKRMGKRRQGGKTG